MSITSFFKKSSLQRGDSNTQAAAAPRCLADAICSPEDYIDIVKTSIDANRLDITGNPVVMPPCPFATANAANEVRRRSGIGLLTTHDLAQLALRPVVYAWVPEKIYPDVRVICPACHSIVSSARWCQSKILHSLEKQFAYITKEYICYSCDYVTPVNVNQ